MAHGLILLGNPLHKVHLAYLHAQEVKCQPLGLRVRVRVNPTLNPSPLWKLPKEATGTTGGGLRINTGGGLRDGRPRAFFSFYPTPLTNPHL